MILPDGPILPPCHSRARNAIERYNLTDCATPVNTTSRFRYVSAEALRCARVAARAGFISMIAAGYSG